MNTLTDEHGVEWEILGVPSDFCGAQYAELASGDRRTVRLASQLIAAGYTVPTRDTGVGEREVGEGRCIGWAGEDWRENVTESDPLGIETTPELAGMIEVSPGQWGFPEHE